MKTNQAELPDPFIAPPCQGEIELLYEDQFLIVINKPSGLLSLSGKNPLNKDSAHHRLVQDYPTATMVHRLDFGTSGLMVVALNKTVNASLTKQFQERTIHKNYIATLLGHLSDDAGVIDAPIAKSEFPRQMVCFESGKSAQTQYQVLERSQSLFSEPKTTLVRFTPLTGRTHQLRVHSREIGHPILGCDLYNLTVDGLDSKALADRLMLHACRLSFDHPISGQRVSFTG